jgi:hypothetical protein
MAGRSSFFNTRTLRWSAAGTLVSVLALGAMSLSPGHHVASASTIRPTPVPVAQPHDISRTRTVATPAAVATVATPATVATLATVAPTTSVVPAAASSAAPPTVATTAATAATPTTTTAAPVTTATACQVALAYLAAHAAPGFATFCRPGTLVTAAGASAAYTCVPGAAFTCPDGVAEIIISDPTCAASYENEASNSYWDFAAAGTVAPGSVQDGRTWDPYGACSQG